MVAFESERVVVEMQEEQERRSPRVTDEQAQAAMVAWVVMLEQLCGRKEARVSLRADGESEDANAQSGPAS